MSYLALARRYRPRRFEDVHGQDHVVRALSHALDHDRLHPSILLTGTRGVGKTTLGRIIAKGLNCKEGVSARPCNQCSVCLEVDAGRFMDLIEIDAASRTKVDDTRQLMDNVAYAPACARYKVYLIDEVHMLSTASFNALLKTLEEPPSHVKFILATTDPQKLPVTVLSRCLQFSLKRLPTALIRQVLSGVLASENVEAEPSALLALARAADGSMRDGLSLLDQAIACCGGDTLRAELVEDMLGSVGRQSLLDLLGALASGDADALLATLQALDASAPDYAALINDLAAGLQRIAMLQVFPQAVDDTDDPELVEIAGKMAPEDAQLFYQIAVHGRRDLPWAPDPRLGFEMTVLRMHAFQPSETGSGSVPRSRRVARIGDKAGFPTSGSAPKEPPPATPHTASPQVKSMKSVEDRWSQWVERLELEGMARQLALHCGLAEEAEDRVRLLLQANHGHLLTEGRRVEMQRALEAQAGHPVQLQVNVVDTPVNAPVVLLKMASEERQRVAEADIERDPAVQVLRDRLGAAVRPGSVRPLE